MIKEIAGRRSIRKYTDKSVSKSDIEEIIRAGILAPSSKNRQPWGFTVVSGKSKDEMTQVIKQGLQREEKTPLMPESTQYIGGAHQTLKIMEQAPVIIFIENTLADDIKTTLSIDERISEICNAQSIGAAIENMTLTAAELGLGSLWICDTFFAQAELNEWLGVKGELYAALAVGYSDEFPNARPRRAMDATVTWME